MDAARFRTATVELAHEAADGADALPATLELLDRVVGADVLATTPVRRPGLSRALPVVHGAPPLAEWELELWPRLLGTHPFYGRLRTGPLEASRVTDVLSLGDLDRLLVYQLLLRPRACRFHAALILERTDRTLLVTSLYRASHDFGDREMEVLEQVRRALATAFAYRAASTPSGESRPEVAGPLTPRERQVAALVARGMTNEQIGTRLGLSTRTVRKHLENACRRTGSVGRAGLAAWWARRDLTSDRPTATAAPVAASR